MEIYFLNTSKLEIEREGKINRFDYTNKTFLLGNKSWSGNRCSFAVNAFF